MTKTSKNREKCPPQETQTQRYPLSNDVKWKNREIFILEKVKAENICLKHTE